MKLYINLLLLLLAIFEVIEALRFFHHGRMVGGNLGSPMGGRRRAPKDNQADAENGKVTEEWFEQKLDHFAPTDESTWKQRFFTNDAFFDETSGGPVFLMIGGEGPASIEWMTAGAWVEYGKKFGALLIQLEHRYYGKSHPTNDLSTENLKYLSSEQALADLATFIIAMNDRYKLPSDVKWIAFGGSYPGSLAAWLRFKYPHLVHGAMSASGPLLAELDFQDYFKVVGNSLATHSDECVTAIQQGVQQLQILLKKEIGRKNVNRIFALCDPIQQSMSNPDDLSNLFNSIADDFAGIVQYNKDNRIGKNVFKNVTIGTVCDIMVDQSLGTPIVRLGKVNELILRTTKQECLDYKYDNMIDALRNTSWASEASEGGRQWMYQTCTEFGFFQTSSDSKHLFGDVFPVEFFIQQCSHIFGPKYNDRFMDGIVDRTNMIYGGLNIDVSNVVFVHGSIDPWSALGITSTQEQNAPAIFIKGTAHCANMYPSSDNDLPQLKQARVEIENLIDKWLRL